MSDIVSLLMKLGGDNLMSALLVTMLLGTMLIAYFATAPGNPLASRVASLKDRAIGKVPAGKRARFKFNFSMETLKKLVEGLKLTRGAEAQSTADKLVKAGYRSREALVIYMGIRLVLPVLLTSLTFLIVALLHLPTDPPICRRRSCGASRRRAIAASPAPCPTSSTCW